MCGGSVAGACNGCGAAFTSQMQVTHTEGLHLSSRGVLNSQPGDETLSSKMSKCKLGLYAPFFPGTSGKCWPSVVLIYCYSHFCTAWLTWACSLYRRRCVPLLEYTPLIRAYISHAQSSNVRLVT